MIQSSIQSQESNSKQMEWKVSAKKKKMCFHLFLNSDVRWKSTYRNGMILDLWAGNIKNKQEKETHMRKLTER